MNDVAVSIVNHGNRELLLACLASLADDPGRRASTEVVVLDNASEDGSVEAVRERFPDVRVLAQPFRAGFGANHNAVIRADGVAARADPQRGHDRRAGHDRPPGRRARRAPLRRRRRAAHRVPRRPPPAVGVALPEPARLRRRGADARPGGRRPVGRRRARGAWTGRRAARCSCAARPSSASAPSTRASSCTSRRPTSAGGWPTAAGTCTWCRTCGCSTT